MTAGIVLEGGALRGMYTAGVLDVFLENDIHADLCIGVSAGALFGVNYVSGQKGRAIRYNKKYNKDRNYMGLLPLIKEGNFINTEYAYERVPHKLDPFDNEAYRNAEQKFYASITDAQSGETRYVLVEDVFEQMDVLRASGSMPFISKAVEIEGHLYLDGAIFDSIPYQWMLDQGTDKVIVILTQDASYRKKPMNAILSSLYKRKYPKIAEGLARRHLMYNHQLDEIRKLEEEGRIFVIRPSEAIQIGRMERDPDKLQGVYDLGVRDAEALLKELREYLAR